MRIHPAVLCPIVATAFLPVASQARVIADIGDTYTNPETFPMELAYPGMAATVRDDYYPLPTTIDLRPYFKEVTSPGPILTFSYNLPENDYGDALTGKFSVQFWWLDPEPEAEADTDDDVTIDTDDERIVYQNLDLCEPSGTMYTVLNSIGFAGSNVQDPIDPTLPGTIFWRAWTANSEIAAVECGVFELADDDTSHVQYSSMIWGNPTVGSYDYTEGTVSLFYTESTYSLFFNLTDNTNNMYAGYAYTMGKVLDDKLDELRMIAGDTELYDMVKPRTVSNIFTAMPLWNSYTDDEYNTWQQPERDDFVKITGVTMSDPSGTFPTHGLKFLEDQTYDSTEDYDDDDDVDYDDDDEEIAETDFNADIKEYFNLSLSEDGILTISLRDDIEDLSEVEGSSFTYYFRVYVDDGTNNGYSGTEYYWTSMSIYIYSPIAYYFGGASTGTATTYEHDTDGDGETDETETWTWYDSTDFGWFMERGEFPDNRWIYSYEHGWIYLCGKSFYMQDGDYWYMQSHSYDVVTDEDGDDETTDDQTTTTHENPALGWFWTSGAAYPYLYSYKDEGWVYYMKDEDDTDDDGNDYEENILENRLFWSYRQSAYISANGEDTKYANAPIKVHGKTFGTGLDE